MSFFSARLLVEAIFSFMLSVNGGEILLDAVKSAITVAGDKGMEATPTGLT